MLAVALYFVGRAKGTCVSDDIRNTNDVTGVDKMHTRTGGLAESRTGGGGMAEAARASGLAEADSRKRTRGSGPAEADSRTRS